tara:strand:- start:1214 stop:1627 length:414 start_codon:yes stop_codon:yes gene_type:complete
VVQFDPLISIHLDKPGKDYLPGDYLICDYQIDAIEAEEILMVETSVLWVSSGKGDEDSGIHFIRRRLADSAMDADLREMERIETALPPTPLSYNGEILSIQWCVRIRLILKNGDEYVVDQEFRVSDMSRPKMEGITA